MSESRPLSNAEKALAERCEALRQRLFALDPGRLAEVTGATFADGVFALAFFGQPLRLTYPGGRLLDEAGRELPPYQQALLLYYFLTADGTAPSGRWISFADLPDGRVYAQAFQGYTGADLTRAFGNQVEAFARAARAAGGQTLPLGDAGFFFRALPRLPLAAVYWQGEESLPPTAKILFDESAPHYLPTEVCAVLGSHLTRRILKHRSVS